MERTFRKDVHGHMKRLRREINVWKAFGRVYMAIDERNKENMSFLESLENIYTTRRVFGRLVLEIERDSYCYT